MPPSHKPWLEHARPYQIAGLEFLLSTPAACLFWEPGLGKTAATLASFAALKEAGLAEKMLVVAPKRVCEATWWQEAQAWSEFQHLRFAWLHDSRAPWDGVMRKKNDETLVDADVYLINFEGIPWLVNLCQSRKRWPFDTLVIDELTKMKTHTTARSKALRKVSHLSKRRWGLTGTPAANGYMDLFGQMLLIDGGRSFGTRFATFREEYFLPDGYSGYKWKPRTDTADRMWERLKDHTMRLSAEDYLSLPPLVEQRHSIKLPPKVRAQYDEFCKEMVLESGAETVTAAHAAALMNKLQQFANGAIYLEELPSQPREHVVVHDLKLDALEDLIEEMSGQPLLVAYEFQHDLARIWGRIGETPYIGQGAKNIDDVVRRWNAGEIPVLLAHPQSAGHGLNMQLGGASHVCWFSLPWSLENYTQFLGRVRRSGNTASTIVNHMLVVEDTVDVQKIEALAAKDVSQARLLQLLKTVLPNAETASAADPAHKGEDMAIRKLGMTAGSQQEAPEPAPAAARIPESTLRERLRAKIARDTAADAPAARSEEAPTLDMFASVAQAVEQDEAPAKQIEEPAVVVEPAKPEPQEAAPAPAKRERRRAADKAAPVEPTVAAETAAAGAFVLNIKASVVFGTDDARKSFEASAITAVGDIDTACAAVKEAISKLVQE